MQIRWRYVRAHRKTENEEIDIEREGVKEKRRVGHEEMERATRNPANRSLVSKRRQKQKRAAEGKLAAANGRPCSMSSSHNKPWLSLICSLVRSQDTTCGWREKATRLQNGQWV